LITRITFVKEYFLLVINECWSTVVRIATGPGTGRSGVRFPVLARNAPLF
jgi:hypothetical protein